MMFLPDVNVLLYAIDSSAPQHPRCHDWLNEALNAEEPLGWAWNVLRHGAVLRGLLEAVGLGGNAVSDAHLAALAIEYQGRVCSCETDFARFPGVAWFNPLTP